MTRSSQEGVWLALLVLTLAWGVAAFGSPYPWAYTPLLIAGTTLGLTGLWLGRRSSGPSALPVACFTFFALAVVAQLLPVPASWMAALSPHAGAILSEQSLQFWFGESHSHPLSIDPARTQLGLAFFGGFVGNAALFAVIAGIAIHDGRRV